MLLERTLQLQALESTLNEVTSGGGCVALVFGEAGIGKTSLIEQFISNNKEAWRVLTGGCDFLFTPRPLDPLRDIARQTEGRLLKLLDSRREQAEIFPACLLEMQRQPTIIVIEDIHWADEATLDLLKYLGRRIRGTAALMILTYRDDELGADTPLRLLLGDLAYSHSVHRIQVPALSVNGVHELSKYRNVNPVELHRLTNGNPFFVTEILAGQGGIPQTVRDAVLARAARLSAEARRVLEAAAVVGLRTEPWLLSNLVQAGSAHVGECVAGGMLGYKAGYYAFRHELAREIVLESLPPQRRIELNRLVLTVLKQSRETRDDLARLVSHAAATGDAQVVLPHALAAAQQAAAAGAHRQAAALYELAQQFSDELPDLEHAQMLEAYTDELWYRGRLEAFIPVHREIIERYRALGDRLREGWNLARLASLLQSVGHSGEAEEAIQEAIKMLEALRPSNELARAYQAQSYILSAQMDYVASVTAGEKAIALAEQFGDPDLVSRACNITGSNLLFIGEERGRALLERSLAIAREHGLHYAVGMALGNWAQALVWTFQFEEGDRLLQEGIAFTTQHDDDYHGAGMLADQALIKLYQGHWTEAVEILRQDSQRLTFQEILNEDLHVLGCLGIRRGDAGAAEALKELVSLSAQMKSLEFVAYNRVLLAEAAWLRGDNPQAIEEARESYDLATRSHSPWVTGGLAFWRWRAGEVFTPPDWIARPYALQIAGDWRAAAREWEQRGCPYEQGMALMDGGEEAQLAALAIFERLGARPIVAKLKQKMRLEGLHGIPRGARPATRKNRYGLTTREIEILSRLIKGLSNNAIAGELSLSARTVEHHVGSILQKTGANSRSEAVALALKESLIPSK